MRSRLIITLLAAVLVAGCVGGAKKLRYMDMPDLAGSPSSTGLVLIDCELEHSSYKPGPLDSHNATRCWIVKEGGGPESLTAEHNYGFFVFQGLEPGRYAVTQIEWNATFWITDVRDAADREAAGQTADQVPHDCKFVYTFEAWETPELTFTVEPGKIVYRGVWGINEPAEFAITSTGRPVSTITRNNYAQGMTFSGLASYERRAMEQLLQQNQNTEWTKIIEDYITELDRTGIK